MLNATVVDSVRKFIRLTPLLGIPQYEKRTRTEFELIEALDVVRKSFHETKSMIDKRIYQGQDFDPVEDVKLALEEYLFGSREPKDIPLVRGRNLIMYHLAVAPAIDQFKGLPHQTILSVVDQKLDETINLINTMDIQSHPDDALVTMAQIGVMIKLREEKRKIELAKRRKRRGKKKPLDLVKIIRDAEAKAQDL